MFVPCYMFNFVRNGCKQPPFYGTEDEWQKHMDDRGGRFESVDKQECYRIIAFAIREKPEIGKPKSGWSVVGANLPGAGGQGDSFSEALEDAKRSFAAVINSYRESNTAIPWSKPTEQPKDSYRATIFIGWKLIQEN